MEASFIVAITTGFLGGFGHCIGMCGPIVASYTLQGTPPASRSSLIKRTLPHILYNLGRITTYSFIGAFMGLTGSLINSMSGIQDAVAIIAGLIMILMGISIATGFPGGLSQFEKYSQVIIRVGRELLSERSVWKYYLLGSLFGLLPCGLSYTAFMAAAGTGSLGSGMLYTFLFGAGTIPWLLIFGVAAAYISSVLRGMLYRTAGILVILMGIYYLYKGIKLYAQM